MSELRNSGSVIGYVINGLLTISGGFFIYQIIVNSDWTFAPEWNMFKSGLLGTICVIIGFILAMALWGKGGHWSSTPVIEKRDSFTGRVIERKEDFDITEQLFAKVLIPLLGHFVIEPLIYGALIYYPITCVIWLVGSIFPYLLSLLILGIVIAAWLFSNNMAENNIVVYSIIVVFLSVGFSFGAYYIHQGGAFSYNEPSTDIQVKNSSVPDDEEGFEDADIDESEFE